MTSSASRSQSRTPVPAGRTLQLREAEGIGDSNADLKAGLLGRGFADQEAALAPAQPPADPAASRATSARLDRIQSAFGAGGGGPVVQREADPAAADPAAADPAAADPAAADPSASAAPETADAPIAAAQALRPKLEKEVADAQPVIADLAAKQAELEAQVKELEAAGKAADAAVLKVDLEDLKKKRDRAGDAARKAQTDLDLLDGPAPDETKVNELLARRDQKDVVADPTITSSKTTEVDDRSVTKKDSTAVSYLEDGKATTVTASTSKKVGLLSYAETDAQSKKVVEGDTTTTDKKSSSAAVDLLAGTYTTTDKKEASKDVDGKKSGESTATKNVYGADGFSTTTTDTKTTGKEQDQKSTAMGVTRGDGKLGVSYTVGQKKGEFDEENEMKKGATSQTKLTGGIIEDETGHGAFAGADQKVGKVSDNGVKTGASVGGSGSYRTEVKQISQDPPRYVVTTTVSLGGKLGADVGREKAAESGEKASATVNAAGSVKKTVSYQHEMSADEVLEYQKSLETAASGGAAGGLPELQVLGANAKGGASDASMVAATLGKEAQGADGAAAMKAGDKVTSTTSADGSLGVDLAGKGGPGTVGIGGGVSGGSDMKLTTAMGDDGCVRITPDVKDKSGVSASASGGAGVASMKVGYEGKEFTQGAVKFKLNPKDPMYQFYYDQIAKMTSQEEMQTFAAAHPDLVESTTTGKGHSDTTTTSVALGGVDVAGMTDGGHYAESKTVGKDGKTSYDYEGGNDLGGNVAGITSNSAENMTARVGADGKVAADVSTTDTDTDLGGTVAKTAAAVEKNPLAVASGGAKLKAETTHVAGMQLDANDIAAIAARAKDGTDWPAVGGHLAEPLAQCRAAIVAANGDAKQIAAAMAHFMDEGGHGAEGVVESMARKPRTGQGGSAYELPEGLVDQKAAFTQLVVGDPLAEVKKKKDAGDLSGARTLAESIVAQTQSLYAAVNTKADAFEDPARLGEMLAKISARQLAASDEVRALRAATGPVDQKALDEEGAREHYDQLLAVCQTNKGKEEAWFAQIAEANADHDAIKATPLVNQLRELMVTWKPAYQEVERLALDHGFGKDGVYRNYKPDETRLQIAYEYGDPNSEEAKAAQQSANEKAAVKKPAEKPVARAAADPVGDGEKAVAKAEHASASGFQAQVNGAQNKAVGAGNRLYAWLQDHQVGAALAAHNEGMASLQAARASHAKCGKNATDLDWNTYGMFAIEDYDKAFARFSEGLALYPGGMPASG